MRPYSPLELAGREIYIREGCYLCHSQMIRPMRDEVERYGHYSLAAESMYDHPFQWGSKRTGPDVARVGGRYSDSWHVDHLTNPQSVVPESVMPKYAFLLDRPLDGEFIEDLVATHRMVGVPYSDDMVASAQADFLVQVDPDGDGDAHFVTTRAESVTRPGITIFDVRTDLRPDPLPGVGDLVGGAGSVFRGSRGQKQVEAVEFHVAQ